MFDDVELVPEHLTRPRRGDDGPGVCNVCGVTLTYADTAPCELDHGVCPIGGHDWQSGADGAFAGLTEHCSKCEYER